MKRKMAIALSVAIMSTTYIGNFTYATPTTQSKIYDLEDNIRKADNEIEGLMIEVDKLKTEIKQNEENLKTTKIELKKAEETRVDKEEAFNKRAAVLYKEGYYDTGGKLFFYLKGLTGSKDIMDLINNIEYTKRIIEYDTELLEELKEVKNSIETKKEHIEEQGRQLEENSKLKQEKFNEMETKKQELLNKLEQEKEVLREQQERERQEQERQARLQAQIQAQANLHTQVASRAPALGQATSQQTPVALPSSATSSSIVAESYKYLGIPYRWGGTTTSGFDCSGFMQFLFNKYGVSLPRVSQAQQNVGALVSLSQIQPGDLVFFGNPAHHVGMYVGNGNYIHSPQTGDVIKISPLSSRTPSTIRRVL